MAKGMEMDAMPDRPSGWRQGMDRIYCYLAAMFFFAVLVQVFLAGVGAFGDQTTQVANAESFEPHRTLGTILGGVAFLLFLVALAVHISRSTVVGALLLVVLTVGAQAALANGGDSNKWTGGLHALDGMVILLLSLWLAVAAYRRTFAGRRLSDRKQARSQPW